MTKILVAGAGGAPSEGVINSLLLSPQKEEIIGMGAVPSDLALSNAKRKYVVPYGNDPKYKEELLKVLEHEHPDLIHFQNDLELYRIRFEYKKNLKSNDECVTIVMKEMM